MCSHPRCGCPPCYAPQLLEVTYELLAEDDTERYTAATLAAMLIHHGILHKGVNKRAFMCA